MPVVNYNANISNTRGNSVDSIMDNDNQLPQYPIERVWK